jgi:Homeodomain
MTKKYESAAPDSETETEEMGEHGDSKVFGNAAENDKKLATFFDLAAYRLEYEDLNECVAALFKKPKESDASQRDIKRR